MYLSQLSFKSIHSPSLSKSVIFYRSITSDIPFLPSSCSMVNPFDVGDSERKERPACDVPSTSPAGQTKFQNVQEPTLFGPTGVFGSS